MATVVGEELAGETRGIAKADVNEKLTARSLGVSLR